ncbi:MAG: hypothetical protein GX384_01245 [Clostridiaceae bacterium]|jgi:hypothetical protein|nr:hypothetical protein [Bacillota bacterium]NLI37958.1 hypothetical protein [Clostridiaceae bacterium]
MNSMNQDFSELEQRLESVDFYSQLADKDGMFRDFVKRLDQREQCSKPRERRRVMRPAAIAAMIVMLTLITCFTVFADSIEGLLMQLFFTGGTANKVEHLSEEYDPDISSIGIILGAIESPHADENDESKTWAPEFRFDTLDEAKESLAFTPLEPKGLDNWKLTSIRAFSNDGDTHSYALEMVYELMSEEMPSPAIEGSWEQSIESGYIPRYAEFYVYQHYIGDDAVVRIDTIEDIQTVNINGIEAVLTGLIPYDMKEAYSLTWVQDGTKIDICPSSCTYDELISFAEAFIKPVEED